MSSIIYRTFFEGKNYVMETTTAGEIKLVSTRVLKTENGYGLLIYIDGGENKLYSDLSLDYGRICRFSDAVNHGKVSSLHIEDMIEDFLE